MVERSILNTTVFFVLILIFVLIIFLVLYSTRLTSQTLGAVPIVNTVISAIQVLLGIKKGI